MADKKAKEPNLEKRLRDRVKKLGGIAIKFFCLSFTGLPDRVILMPGGRVWFVELKSQGKKPTPRQLWVHGFLRKLGFEVWVIDRNSLLDQFLNHLENESIL